jgi:hypothetical protein
VVVTLRVTDHHAERDGYFVLNNREPMEYRRVDIGV